MNEKRFFQAHKLLVILFAILLFPGCASFNFDPSAVYSDTGKATVGQKGGTITVVDSTSKINGVTIDVPEGALSEKVAIEIIQGESEYINGEELITVKFLPDGLEFSEPVIIGIPWSTTVQTRTNSMVYYINEEDITIEETEIDEVDVENKITYSAVNHFSSYFNKPQYYSIGFGFVRSNDQFMAYGNLYTPLSSINPKLIDSPYANAEEIVISNDGMQDCFAVLYFNLWKKDKLQKNYLKHFARQDFYIKYKPASEGWEVIVYRYDNPLNSKNQAVEVFRKSGLYFDQLVQEWLTGFPIVASFNKSCFNNEYYEVQPDDEFDVTISWQLVKKLNPIYASDVWTWGCRKNSKLSTFSKLQKFEDDKNKNNIVDEYELVNAKPLVPSNPQPVNYATKVSVNTILSWACSDPDGDELTYNVYFGTTNDPGYLGSASTPGYTLNELENNTTYYWYITAIDINGAMSTSQVWEFTTEAEIVHTIGCGGITEVEYEGKIYHTVEIGDQCWFKENLNVGIRIDGANNQTDNKVIEKYCYYDDEAKCDAYGGLYQWDELMQYTSVERGKGICPAGWHVPSSDEWKILEGNVDSQYGIGDPIWDDSYFRGQDAGKKLKTTTGWFNGGNGTDDYGFSVLPSGQRSQTNGGYSEYMAGSYIWTSSKSVRFFAFNDDRISINTLVQKQAGAAVRCIKD